MSEHKPTSSGGCRSTNPPHLPGVGAQTHPIRRVSEHKPTSSAAPGRCSCRWLGRRFRAPLAEAPPQQGRERGRQQGRQRQEQPERGRRRGAGWAATGPSVWGSDALLACDGDNSSKQTVKTHACQLKNARISVKNALIFITRVRANGARLPVTCTHTKQTSKYKRRKPLQEGRVK